MELDTFFATGTLLDISRKIKNLHSSSNLNFELFLNEKHVKLYIKYSKDKENSKNSLLLIFTALSDKNAPAEYNLDFTQTLLDYFQPDDISLDKVSLELDGFGSHSPKNNCIISSQFIQFYECRIINSNFYKILVSGKFDKLLLSKISSHDIKINGQFDVIKIKNILGFNTSGKYSGFISIMHSKANKMDIHWVEKIARIELIESTIDDCGFSVLKVKELKLSASGFGRIKLFQNELDIFLLKDTYALKKAELHLQRNKIKLMHADNIRFHKENEWLNKLFSNRKIWSFKILLDLNEIENLKLKRITWDYDSILDPDSTKKNKQEFILQVKNFYNSIQDIPEEKLFKSFEKLWHYKNGNKSLPLIFGYLSNSFGLSFLKPFAWIVFFILMEIGIIYFLGTSEFRNSLIENWGLITYLVNPAHSSGIFLDLLNECKTCSNNYVNFVPSLDNIFRIIIGYLIFQFIDAFRYKYNLGR